MLRFAEVRIVDYVVVEHGSSPMDDIYYELKGRSRNAGQLNQTAMMEGAPPFADNGEGGNFYLARIGDASVVPVNT